MSIRLPDLNAANYCQTYFDVTARVAYVGTRTIIVEDNMNFNYGLIDTTYAQIGAEFDNTMFDILSTNFGNPLASDALTDNNGKIMMVFTHKVNDKFTGIAGFVAGCDFYPRTTWASSNVGEYFYAKASTVSGNISVSDSPPAWRWGIRSTIIHEVKHVTSFAERFSRGAAAYEESWLEETTARISEELYERARYSFTQRSNIGYGSAANSVGPYCGVRACNGQPRGIIRVFQELADKWYLAPQDYSPLGRLSSSDFSFYATGWSLVRWALDANVAQTESAILKGLIQESVKTGVANFDAHMGTTFADALPKWTFALVLDDYPSFTPADASLKQPSWNFRDVMAGLKTDYSASYASAWPFVPFANSFGSFTQSASVRPGTSAMIELTGTQTAKQLIELKASGSTAAAPAELRIAIVRVQ